MKTTEILEKVAAERTRQDSKWGYPQKNTLPEWGIILGEEVGEAMKELNELHFRRRSHPSTSLGYLITELIQTAAVAVSIVEHLTEYGIAVDDRHPVVFEDRFDTDADQIPEDDETVDEDYCCPTCSGTGTVKGLGGSFELITKACPDCHGTGRRAEEDRSHAET